MPGSQDLSERGLGVEERADEAISTSSCVRGTLALGDVVKVEELRRILAKNEL